MVSDLGMLAISAYDASRSCAEEARHSARDFSLKLLVNHLHNEHGMGIYKIASSLKMPRLIIKKILTPDLE